MDERVITLVEVVAVPPILSPIFGRVRGNTSSSTAVRVLMGQVKPDEWWILDFASLQNASGESLTLQWVIVRGAEVILVSEDITVADGDAVRTNVLPQLLAGERFGAQVVGTAASGPVILVVSAHSIP